MVGPCMRLGVRKCLVSLMYILFEDCMYFFWLLLGAYVSLNEDFVVNWYYWEHKSLVPK